MKIPTKLAPRKQTPTSALADAVAMDAETAIMAARLATAAAAKIPPPPPNPIYQTLAQAEQGALRRFSPRRSWPDLAEHDQRIAEADRDRETVHQRIQDLRTQLSLATVQDEQHLVTWLRDERGARPEPSAPALEQEIARAHAELDARAAIVAQLEADKERFVIRHRKRLFMDAQQATEAARARYLEAIDSLVTIREEVRNARQAAIYAQIYPSPNTGSEPPASLVAGRLDIMRRSIPSLNTTLELGGSRRCSERTRATSPPPRPSPRPPRSPVATSPSQPPSRAASPGRKQKKAAKPSEPRRRPRSNATGANGAPTRRERARANRARTPCFLR